MVPAQKEKGPLVHHTVHALPAERPLALIHQRNERRRLDVGDLRKVDDGDVAIDVRFGASHELFGGSAILCRLSVFSHYD